MNRLERLFILLPWMRAHNGSTVEEISSHFQISEEQVVQDILLLPITGSGQFYGEQFSLDWDDDRIYVDDALGIDRPVKFDTAEAATLLLGLEALRVLPKVDTGAIDSAVSKLSSVLPLSSQLHIVSKDFSLDEKSAIAKAFDHNLRVQFDYWNSGRDDKSTRQVSPLRVYFKDGLTLLDGYCHSSQGWRTFRFDRISRLETDSLSAALPDTGFQEMELMAAEVSVDSAFESLLEDFLVDQRTEKSGRVYATIRIFGSAFLTRRILSSGGRLKVHSPATLVTDIQEGVLAALNAYEAK